MISSLVFKGRIYYSLLLEFLIPAILQMILYTPSFILISQTMLPLETYARCLAEFKNRLWLGYPDGRLTFSNVGNPVDFDSTTFSGTIYLEDEILDLVVGTGDALFVFCKNSIQIIKALTSDSNAQTVVDYLFSNTTLINNTEIIEGTAVRLFDDILYVDDRGLTSISATDAYGDFFYEELL